MLILPAILKQRLKTKIMLILPAMTEDNVYPMIEAKTKNKLNVKSENTTFISSDTAQII